MEEGLTKDILILAKSILNIKEMNAGSYSPLNLAYIGDAIYELVIRTMIMSCGNIQVNKMHKQSSELVKAGTQSSMITALDEELTEEERSIYKRGRNAKSSTKAKNATMMDYRKATGFEALIGYLYLTEQFERMFLLIHNGLERIGKQL